MQKLKLSINKLHKGLAVMHIKWQDDKDGIYERIMDDIAAIQFLKDIIDKGGVVLEALKVEERKPRSQTE